MESMKGSRSFLRTAAILCLTFGSTGATRALTLPDAARQTAAHAEAPGSTRLPVGPWAGGEIEMLDLEGTIHRTAFRMKGSDMTTLATMRVMRSELVIDGYDIRFECTSETCGGFDFRYSLEVLPEPEMHVDLGDFRYLLATRMGGGGSEAFGLLVSRSDDSGFIQITEVSPSPPAAASDQRDGVEYAAATTAPGAAALVAVTPEGMPVSMATRLETDGHVPLDDLVFTSGASELVSGEFPSLADLARYLADHPDRKITLVGHTDATGALAANVALSRRRAESVAAYLVKEYGVPASQIAADGVGFLAPRASNLTEDGRQKNRRVEAMLTSTR